MFKLIKGDCLEKMKNIPDKSIDMILCDLPYGTTRIKWDTIIPLEDFISVYINKKRVNISRENWLLYNINKLKEYDIDKINKYFETYKKLPTYNPQKTQGHTPIHSYTKYISTQNNTELYGEMKEEISGGGETDRFPRSVQIFASDKQKEHLHPTQKPIALLEYLIKTYTNENEIILDNCMGSGSTGIACLNTNRNFIGIEKDEKYFNIAKKRIIKKIEDNKLEMYTKIYL